ncbi:metallopeptidase [Leptospira ryugenii]|uniref:Metallopeptidase n=2 Tax=Leptospira ryugenii TaxID=1917863 RepID=A0A2P2DVD5_9LEPT|nr:metallopeptidase [Leptospira ryugenii]
MFSVLGAILLVVSVSAFAAYQKKRNEPVYLDNHVFQRYQNYWGVWINFKTERKTLEEKVAELGSDWEDVIALNALSEKEKNAPKRFLFLPYGAEYAESLEKQGQFREAIESQIDQFIWPVLPNSRTKITSRIGRRWNSLHTGVDIAIPRESIVLAAADGVVEIAGRSGDYGNTVKIYHNEMNHFHTVYGHNTEVLVKAGDIVKKGQIIAFSGNTGKSTGPHVHFEVRYHNVYLNPENFLSPFEEGLNTSAVSVAKN